MENSATVEEKGVFDSVDFDETSEFKALVRSIKRADGFSLLFARCNERPKQKELMKKVFSELPQKRISVFYFENPIENLLDEIRQRLIDENPAAVFVYGLESSMPKSETADKTSLILNLNATRNAFPTVIDCPLVFWLPTYALKAVMNGAPDFFSVRSGVFFFENDEKLMSQQISEANSLSYGDQTALLLEERQNRLENLKDLLTEYQSLPQNKRDIQAEYQLKDRLANMYYQTANFDKAEKLRKQLLQESRSKDKKTTAKQLNELALVYRLQGNYEEAIKLFKEALNIDEKTIGKEHPDYATHLNNLALVYQSQGKYEEAIKLFKEALDIDEKTMGKKHPDHATRLNNLASVYDTQGNYEEAIKLYKAALDIDEKTIGKEHPDHATRLNNLASVYDTQGNYEEAIKLFKEALDIDEKTIGKEHPDYATRLNNLALVYQSQGKYEEAITLYKEALNIGEKTIGKEHPDYAIRLNNLAGVYQSQGKYEEALPLYEEALRILIKVFGENHPTTKIVKRNLERIRKNTK